MPRLDSKGDVVKWRYLFNRLTIVYLLIHVSTYDIVLYNKKYIFDLHPVSSTELLKTLAISCDNSHKGILCYDNEATFGHLRMGAGYQ